MWKLRRDAMSDEEPVAELYSPQNPGRFETTPLQGQETLQLGDGSWVRLDDLPDGEYVIRYLNGERHRFRVSSVASEVTSPPRFSQEVPMGKATSRLLAKLAEVPVIAHPRKTRYGISQVDAHMRELDLRPDYVANMEDRVPGQALKHPRVLTPMVHARMVDSLMEQATLNRGTALEGPFKRLAEVIDTSSSPRVLRAVADNFATIARRNGRGDLARWSGIARRIADQLEGRVSASQEEFERELVMLAASLSSGHPEGSAVERMAVKLAAQEYDQMVELAAKTFTKSEREKAPTAYDNDEGGAFPINNVSDLKNAIQAIGRAKDPAKAKAHIKSRAKALGATNLIPKGW
jgi:hypothetical protein